MILDYIKAVIFDLDGTLVDSMWMWEDIDIEYLGRYGLSCPEDLQKAIEGMSFTETAVYFKERFGLPDSIEEIKEAWIAMSLEKYEKEVPLKPDVYKRQVIAPEIDTIFLTTNLKYSYLSSSIVKEIAEYDGDISGFLHPATARRVREKLEEIKKVQG